MTKLKCVLILGLLALLPTAMFAWEKDKPAKPPVIPPNPNNLPQVLLIGDSISGGYYKLVAKALEGKAVVAKSSDNGESTAVGVLKIDDWLGTNKWDVIHFNWGVWDMYGWQYASDDRSPAKYAERLDQLVTRMKKTGAKLIWATTTPVPPKPEATMLKRFKKVVMIDEKLELEYREAALQVMKKHGVAVNDLYALLKPCRSEFQADDNVHFSPAGSGLMAQQVARSILGVLEADKNAAAKPVATNGFVWPSAIPADCPFERSTAFTSVYFTGRNSSYCGCDTWYPSWASDGNQYTPWADGGVDGIVSSAGAGGGTNAATGQAVMLGDDPMRLEIHNTAPPQIASALPYHGRYPCGSLVHNGIWYYGTYCLGPSGGFMDNGIKWNWPNLGPMPGFRLSRDYGKTWEASPHTPENPLFPEPANFLGPVKMGSPHFVDFGKNMEYSPDGKAYLLGMGAEENDPQPRPCLKLDAAGNLVKVDPSQCTNHFAHANLSWVSADQVYLARVKPSPETINDVKAYEFFAGHDANGKPVWTSDFARIKPLLEWNNHMGCVTATYDPGLKKYLMCVTDGWPTFAKMDSYILEADEITGPWRIVTYLKDFGEQAYFLNFPSKFISPDGRTLWLCFSANFSPGWNGVAMKLNPPRNGHGGLRLHEIKLLGPGENPAGGDTQSHRPSPQTDLQKTGPDFSLPPAAREPSVQRMQEEFLKLKFGMFIHFNMETYHGVQWVAGYQNPADFNPGGTIDTDAWADAAKSAGMKYAILTAKHVSGFCLWDSKYTTYDVMNTNCPYQQDLVAQFIRSFKSRGIEVGLYYCWRDAGFAAKYKVLPPECDPATHSFTEQIEFQKKQIAELVEKYPDAFCIWNDGLDSSIMPAAAANAFYRSLGRDVLGVANWWDWEKKGSPFLDVAVKEMHEFPATNQYPGETCWTLENSWFWSEGTRPKTAKEVVDRLKRANDRHANFLLNVGPNKQGKFEPASIAVLAEVGKLLKEKGE